MSAPTYDPFEAAEQAQPRNKRYFGHTTMQARPVVLAQKAKPQPFVEGFHKEEDRRTQVTVSLAPLPGSRYMDLIIRECLVESSEWTRIVLPSIHEAGLKPRDFLAGLYCQLEMIPVRPYTTRDGKPGMATIPKVIAVYPNEGLCRAAQDALYGPRQTDAPAQQAASAPTAAPASAPAPSAGMTPEARRNLLEALWTASGKDVARMGTLLAATPQFRHLTVQSDEVRSAMAF